MHEAVIQLKVTLTDDGMRGFLDTAMQAIAYWDDEGVMTFDDRKVVDGWLISGTLHYANPSADGMLQQRISYRWIARAVEAALDPAFEVCKATRSTIYDCAVRDAIGELDGDAVDAVMQAGLFGELVYG